MITKRKQSKMISLLVFSVWLPLLLTTMIANERLVAPISCSPAARHCQPMLVAAASAALASITAPVTSGVSVSVQEMLIRLQPASRGNTDDTTNSTLLASSSSLLNQIQPSQLEQRHSKASDGGGLTRQVDGDATTQSSSGAQRPEVGSSNSSSLQRYLERKRHGEKLKDHEQSGFWREEKNDENGVEARQKHAAAEEAKNLMDLGHNRHGWKNVYHREEYAQHQKYHDVFRDKKWDHEHEKSNGNFASIKGDKFNRSQSKDYFDKDKQGSQYDYQKGNQWRRHEDEHYDGGSDADEHETTDENAANNMLRTNQGRSPPVTAAAAVVVSHYTQRPPVDFRSMQSPITVAQADDSSSSAFESAASSEAEPDEEMEMKRMMANLERLSSQVEAREGPKRVQQGLPFGSQSVNSYQNIRPTERSSGQNVNGRNQRKARKRQQNTFGRYVINTNQKEGGEDDHNDDDDDRDGDERSPD